MTYIPLHTTLVGENVSETNALNNNFLEIDQQLQGFKASNGSNNAPVSVLNPEIGMTVYSSYTPDSGGAKLYVSDGTNWHTSDQKEVWGAWTQVFITDANLSTGSAYYRTSNFGRTEWSIEEALTNTPANGQWQTMIDPNLQTAGQRVLWTAGGPAAVGGAAGQFIYDGQISSNVLGSGGHGETNRWAFFPNNVGGTNYVAVAYFCSYIALSSGGFPNIQLSCIFDGSGYTGCLV